MKKSKKRLLAAIIAAIIIISLFTACGKQWTCDICGKNFSGKAYYGMNTDDTYCEDCARQYWMPLPYQNYVKK